MKPYYYATKSCTAFLIAEWLDSLNIQGMTSDLIPLVKKLARLEQDDLKHLELYPEHENKFFTYQNGKPILKHLSELPSNASIEKTHQYIITKQHDAVQKYAQAYINKIITRLYQANSDILGTQPEQFCINCSYHQQTKQKKKKDNSKGMFILLKRWPPYIELNLYDFGTAYYNEDVLAWEIAHELIHLTLARQFVHRTPTDKEEAVCDMLGAICIARAGYRPAETIVDWAQYLNDHLSGLTKCILYNQIDKTLPAEEMYYLYDAHKRGLIHLSEETLPNFSSYQKMEPPKTHPPEIIRMLYTNQINNYLFDIGYLKPDPTREKVTPIDDTLVKMVHEKRSKRNSTFVKHSSSPLKAKLMKRYQKRCK